MFDAHRRGDIVATSGRSFDFYGPGGALTGLADSFWPRALAGTTAYSPYPPDVVRVMNPHEAKGLDAAVVLLVDPCEGGDSRRGG